MSRRRAPLTAAATAGLILAAAWPARADDGLPQLNTAMFPEQLFWLAVTFTFLYVLMAFVALPAVCRTQDRRTQTISAELAAAQQANDDAKSMMARYEKALADARAKAQATVGEIAARAAQESAARQAEQHRQLTKRLNETEAKIAAVRNAAVKQVRETAIDLASAIVEKLIRTKLSSIS